MGQKTNAYLFRLGTGKKNWDYKHIEKTKEEASFYLYKNVEIQKYINRFFRLYRLNLHSFKINYSDNLLQFFISYHIAIKTIYIVNKIHSNQNLLIKDNRKQKKTNFIYKRMKIIKKIKNTLSHKKFQTKQTSHLNNFGEVLLESLSIYTKRKVNIALTLQNLNTNSHSQLKKEKTENLKSVLLQLKKFVKNIFFKEAVNVLFIVMTKRKSAKLLSDFISNQIKLNQLRTDQSRVSKKDNYFIGFLKQALGVFVKSEVSSIKGIKLVIKGRINGAARARSIILQFGKLPLQSFNAKIDYSQSTAYTPNGTFGVKVWVCEG
jgi:hypothetical protein